jgi:DsbC/DsbD-like thiol-disulfide interchange protein
MIAVAQLVFAVLLAAASVQPGQQSLGQDNPLGTSRANQQWVSLEDLPEVTIAPGKTATATLRFAVDQGKHVNSSKPTSELLIPTKLTLEAPAGITIAKISYPSGQDLTFPFDPDEKLNVYTGPFAVTVQLRATAGVAPGSLPLHGELLYQACNDRACFPPKRLPVEFEVKVQRPANRDRAR